MSKKKRESEQADSEPAVEFPEYLAIAGVVISATGIACIYVPAAIIWGGLCMMAAAWVLSR